MRFKNLSYLNRKGPRYIKQRDYYSCSAIALLNADKWLGKRATRRDLLSYREKLGTKKDGTYGSSHINYFGENSRISSLRLKEVDKVLKKNGIIYAIHLKDNNRKYTEKIETHTFLIVEKTRKGYKCVNIYLEDTISFVSRKEMSRFLRRRAGSPSVTSYGWPIYKKEEGNIVTV